MLNSIDRRLQIIILVYIKKNNQPTYSEKSGLGRWCWQGAGFRGAVAHQLMDMPEKSKQKIIILSLPCASFSLFHPPPSRRPLSSIRFP
jgi:hypothetical protein